MKQIKIFFFGDSICFGQGISLHKGWVPMISEKLDSLAQEHECEIIVVNASVNGRTTRQALEDMPYQIQSHQPDILIVQFGLNDCNYWKTDNGVPRVSPKAFAANLEEIIERGFNSGAKKIFLNSNHLTEYDFPQTIPSVNIKYQDSNEKYCEIIREVAANYENVILNDIEQAFKQYISRGEALSKLLLPDKLHISEEGHKLYFCSIYPLLELSALELI